MRSSKIYGLTFFAIIGALYTWALGESVLSATILDIPSGRMLAYSVGFVLLLNLIFFSKLTALVSLGVLLGGTLLVLGYLYFGNFEAQWFVQSWEAFEAFALFAQHYGYYHEAFSIMAGLGIAFLFAFVTVLNTRLHFGFFSLTLVAVGVIAVPMYMGWGYSSSAMVVVLFCILALLAKRLYMGTLRSHGAQTDSPARYGLALLPLCLLLFMVGWVAPKPGEEAIRNLNFFGLGGIDGFFQVFSSEHMISFTNDGQRLGGPAQLNDLVVMVVEAQERVYLTGAIRDYYTGYSWISTVPYLQALAPDAGWTFTTDPNPEPLRRVHESLSYDHDWPVLEMTITTVDVRTDAIFTPPSHQTLRIYAEVIQNAYGNLRTGRMLPRESSYVQSYISWDIDSEEFSDILRATCLAQLQPLPVGRAPERLGVAGSVPNGGQAQSEPPGPSGAAYMWRQLTQLDIAPASVSPALAPIAATIDPAPFLQLPYDLPQRVSDLALEVTAGLETNYDKLRALEYFLLHTFPYTLNAEVVPPGQDFVDHFLFDARAGYCVHYASAMVVMARTLGIPTRFVEGFIMPENTAGDGRFWVTNQLAHAWVEAYFVGFGWAKFEPTATYNLFLDWPAFDGPFYDYFWYFDMYDDWMFDWGYMGGEFAAAAEREAETGALQNVGRTTFTAFFVALAAGGLFGLYKLISRYRKRQRRLEQMTNRESVVALFASTLGAAQSYGCPISPDETALVYANRTRREPIFAQGDITQFAGIYSKAAYSGHEITACERASAQKARDSALERLKALPRNLPRYWVERYILLRY